MKADMNPQSTQSMRKSFSVGKYQSMLSRETEITPASLMEFLFIIFLINFLKYTVLKVTFQLQLLQNIGSVPMLYSTSLSVSYTQ